MALELLLGVAIALFLDAKDYRGKRLVTSILLLPMMATPVAVAMVWLLMFEPTAGVINYAIGRNRAAQAAVDRRIQQRHPFIGFGGHLGVDAADHAIVLAGLTGLPSEPFEAARRRRLLLADPLERDGCPC